MNKQQKQKLVNKYMVEYPEITAHQREWCQRHTAEWITVTRDKTGKHYAHCSSCNTDIELGKTKHKSKAVCPHCGKELEVLHMWRFEYFEDNKFVVIPRALNSKELMLRYVYIGRKTNNINEPHIVECARLVMSDGKNHTFEINNNGEWWYTKVHYFTEQNMYFYRSMCCLQADEYTPLLVKELRKLDSFKYLSAEEIKALWAEHKNVYVNHKIALLAKHAKFYEKLFKVGLNDLVFTHLKSCGTWKIQKITYNENETKITKMLGINRGQINILKKHQTSVALETLRNSDSVKESTIALLTEANVSVDDIKRLNTNGFNADKVMRYCIRQRIAVSEWLHYTDTLRRNNFPMDDAYMYPRDFRTFEDTIEAEINERRDAVVKRKEAKQSELMSKIAKGLRECDELREFFSGTNGLIVYVPDKVNDLKRESRRLHNCLWSYSDRISEGKTLVFFIRKMDDPTAPYVAMEYCHGRVMQCRLDYNKPATGKVIDFAEALASKLQKLNILAA